MIFNLFNWRTLFVAPFQFQVAAAIGAVATVAGSVMQSNAASDAADTAAGAQTASAQAQIAESRRQFDEIRKLLEPYTAAGPSALTGQQNLLGLNGASAQQNAISALANSPQMAALSQQGENAILQNASATGGLRGGNTQAALAQFRPQLLNQLIDQQYQRLGGLTTLGQNSAAGVGNAGQNSSAQIINALGLQGAAQAGNALAQGRASAGLASGLASAGGLLGSYLNNGTSFGGSSGINMAGVPQYQNNFFSE